MMDKVEQERNPTSLAAALGFDAMLMRHLGDSEGALAAADRLILLASEQKLYLWVAIGMLSRASALVATCDGGGALPVMQQGLMILQSIGTLLSFAYYQVELAEAHLLVGDLDAASAAIDVGLGFCATSLARFFAPELHRLRGVVLARRGEAEAAEASVRCALDLARSSGARSYELHAATTLAELLREGPRRAEGRAVLDGVLGGFAEGFDTLDLRRAREVLASL